MAADTENKKNSIISLADEIRKSKKTSDTPSTDELKSLVESLKKQRSENTATRKILDNVTQKLDKATNPTTYLKAIVPKFFKTFHENLETYNVERAALKKIEQIETAARKKEISELAKNLNELIAKDSRLSDIQQKFGEKAAQMAALSREEMKKVNAAEEEYIKNMGMIDKRLQAINEDARQEWAKQKGIQLVKIVEDEPSKEALDEIKEKLSKQIEADANKYETERLESKKKATDERRYKESMLKEQGLFRKLFSKKEETKPKESGFLSQLLGSWALENLLPLLVKGGLIAALIAGIDKYFKDPEFKEKVNAMMESFWEMMKGFMKEHWGKILVALALLFPGATLEIIGAGLKLLSKLLSPTLASGVIMLLRGLAAAMMGPAGVIALLALFAIGLEDWLVKNTDWGKQMRKNQELQDKIKNPQKEIAPPQNVPPARTTPNPVTAETKVDDVAFKEEVERRAQKRASDLFIKGGMIIRNADGTYTDTYLRTLMIYRKEEEEKLRKEFAARDAKNGKSTPAPAPVQAPPPKDTSEKVTPPAAPAGGTSSSLPAGQQVAINAPSNSNTVNNTTVLPWKSAIDPARKMMFEIQRA